MGSKVYLNNTIRRVYPFLMQLGWFFIIHLGYTTVDSIHYDCAIKLSRKYDRNISALVKSKYKQEA